MTYWILTTHLASIFPISVYTWSYRNRKDVESLFMLLQTIFIVTFSIFYHTYHVSDINTEPKKKDPYGLFRPYTFYHKYHNNCYILPKSKTSIFLHIFVCSSNVNTHATSL